MGVSVKLAISYLKSNKKKTLITAICILISTVLITTILLLIDSYKEYMINSERNKANWEVAYSGIIYEEACTIEKHSNVREISVMKEMGEAKKKDDKDIVIPEKIIGFDEIAIKNLLKNNLQAGRLPENSNEVIRTDGSYKIGDKLVQTLDDGKTKETSPNPIRYFIKAADVRLYTILLINSMIAQVMLPVMTEYAAKMKIFSVICFYSPILLIPQG